jgi:uncharacterized damage-inducible protein DinB
MNPLKTYDYLVVARGRIFNWVRPLTAEAYTREFPIGPGSIARTLAHMYSCEWYYVLRMQGLPVLPYADWPIREDDPPPFTTLEAEWTRQAAVTRAAVLRLWDQTNAASVWTRELEYTLSPEPGETGNGWIVTTAPADIFTQLTLHEVHHRAQVMNMLRQLGTTLDDIDYNAINYRRRPA